MALKAPGVRTNPQKDANWTQQSVQSGICKVVPMRDMQAFKEVEIQLHTHST